MANRPSEGSRATRQALDEPSRENIRRYLRVHIDDESLVTDELVDYIHRAHNWSPEFIEARRQSVSLSHDYTQDLAQIRAPVLQLNRATVFGPKICTPSSVPPFNIMRQNA